VLVAHTAEAEGQAREAESASLQMLRRILRQRCGELLEAAVARVNAATPKEVEAWTDRVLTAANGEFSGSSRTPPD
jgi:hypothetical protein